MKRILCVLLNDWPITVAGRRRARGRLGHQRDAIVIIRTVADRQVIVSASESAQALHIRAGMTLTEARALHAAVLHADHDPLRDAKSLEALARWMMRFTPTVSCITGVSPVPSAIGSKGSSSSKRNPHGRDARGTGDASLFLDITGNERLFHGLSNLVFQVQDSLARFNIPARIAVAPTPGAAWALASAAEQNALLVEEVDLEAALAPLPPAALRISDGLADALHHMGLETIEQLIHLPREVLPSRFGDELLYRLDQALGRIAEPLVPLEHVAPIEARRNFDGPVSALEAVWMIFKELLGEVIAQLVKRGCGARQLDVEFVRDGAEPLHRSFQLSRPSRDPVNLFNLFRCSLEGLERERSGFKVQGKGKRAKINFGSRGSGSQGSGVRSQIEGRRSSGSLPRYAGGGLGRGSFRSDTSSSFPQRPLPNPRPEYRGREQFSTQHYCSLDGFVALRLSVPLYERLTDDQVFLLDHEEYAGQLELDRLIERLHLRLGERGVAQAELVESYVPESAWMMGAVATKRRSDVPAKGKRKSSVSSAPPVASGFRPLHLLPTPLDLPVIVSPSHDAEGYPISFTLNGNLHRIAYYIGPERIAGQWWDGRHKTRDYFDVSDAEGKRFWIFRVVETGRWFVHGHW